MNTTLPPHSLYWGRSPRWQPNINALAELPTDTRMILVSWQDASAQVLQALRQRLPNASLMALLDAQAGGAGVTEALALGFDEVVLGDAQAESRLKIWQRLWHAEDTLQARAHDHADLVTLVNDMALKPELAQVLRTAVLRLRGLFGIARAAVVMLRADATHDVAFVVTEGENMMHLDNLMIRQGDHPEFSELVRRRMPLVISDPLAGVLSDTGSGIPEENWPPRSAVLFPLVRHDACVGALFLRGQKTVIPSEDRIMQIGALMAGVTSVALGRAMDQDSAQSTQRELQRRQDAAQLEILNLRQFSDVFEQSFDGILLTMPDGKVRYANPSANAMLQNKDLRGRIFFTLLSAHSIGLAKRAFSGDPVGDAYGYVDLLVGEDRGGETVISAAIRPLAEDGGVLVAFRDVTELREIESELRHTKEVLENLIQSCTDAVVASNVDGQIILFNRAAESLLGYRAREVVGRQSWESLFPRGEGEDILRRVRAAGGGESSRLDSVRQDLLDKNGARVVVNLAASCVYEGDKEVALVGVCTDLRERLKTEDRLTEVQRRVRSLEHQTGLLDQAAQLSHDLTQPLTALLGYAQMLQDGSDPAKASPVLLREAQRAALVARRLAHTMSPEVRAGKAVPFRDDDAGGTL